MSDNAVFNIVRAVKPKKISIPTDNRYNKLTLSGPEGRKIKSRLNGKSKTPTTTKFNNLLNDIEDTTDDDDNFSKEIMEKLQITDFDNDIISNNSLTNYSNFLSEKFANMSVHSNDNVLSSNTESIQELDSEPIPMGQTCPSNIYKKKNSLQNEICSDNETRKDKLIAIADTQSMTADESDVDDSDANSLVDSNHSDYRDQSIVILETDKSESESSSSEDNTNSLKGKDNREKVILESNNNKRTCEDIGNNSKTSRKHTGGSNPKVDISAKISIKIRVPVTSNSSSPGEEESNSSPSLSDRNHSINNDLSWSNEAFQKEAHTPILKSKQDIDADIFLTKSKNLLNSLYGKSWQTPEVISNLQSGLLETGSLTRNRGSNAKLTSSSSSDEYEIISTGKSLRRRINGSYTANCSLDLSTNNQNVCPKIQCEKEKRNQMKDLNQRFNDNLKLIDSKKDTPVSTKSQKKPSKRIEETQLNAIKPKYGFLKSLDECVSKLFADPDALFYRVNYKSEKENLSKRLYDLYNKEVFDGRLNVPIEWNKKLSNSAGRCLNKKRLNIRMSVIELSSKVLTSADRLRCTLIHELCHAAAWIFNGETGHGATWKFWVARANNQFRELPPIKVCHQYDIEYKYTYKCQSCGAKLQAHSKARKVDNVVCKFCHGNIEIFLNKKDKNGCITPTPVKKPSGFAKFVQDNYGKYKEIEKKMTHAEIMKLLSKEFAALK